MSSENDLAVQGGARRDSQGVEKRLLSAIHMRIGLPNVAAGEVSRQIRLPTRATLSRRPSTFAGFAAASAAGWSAATWSAAATEHDGFDAVVRGTAGKGTGAIQGVAP